MSIYAVCGAGICAVCVILVLRQMKSEFAPFVAAAAAAVMLVYVMASLAEPLGWLRDVSYETGLSSYFTLMAKCLGITFVCQTAADICRDCGENSVGSKIELGGKAAILIQTLPVLKSLFELAGRMMGSG